MTSRILHLCTIRDGSAPDSANLGPAREEAAVVHPQRGAALVRDLLPGFTGDILDVLTGDLLGELETAAANADDAVFRDPEHLTYGAPYRHPRMLLGDRPELRGARRRPDRGGARRAGLVYQG